MSGLLRRLTRRRPATADENRPPEAGASEPVSAPAETPAETGGGSSLPGDQPTQVLPETGEHPAAERGHDTATRWLTGRTGGEPDAKGQPAAEPQTPVEGQPAEPQPADEQPTAGAYGAAAQRAADEHPAAARPASAEGQPAAARPAGAEGQPATAEPATADATPVTTVPIAGQYPATAEQAAAEPQPAPARDLPAGVDPAELELAPASARRGKIRRRLRYLRSVRELLLRDLGGFTYEIHRTAGGSPQESHMSLATSKARRISALDAEMLALEARLGEPHAETVLREPGIGGACPECGELHASDAHYCARCGTPLDAKSRAERDAALAAAAPPTTGSHTVAPEEPRPASVLWAGGPRPSAGKEAPKDGGDEPEEPPSAVTSAWLGGGAGQPTTFDRAVQPDRPAAGESSPATAGEPAAAGEPSGMQAAEPVPPDESSTVPADEAATAAPADGSSIAPADESPPEAGEESATDAPSPTTGDEPAATSEARAGGGQDAAADDAPAAGDEKTAAQEREQNAAADDARADSDQNVAPDATAAGDPDVGAAGVAEDAPPERGRPGNRRYPANPNGRPDEDSAARVTSGDRLEERS